MLAVARVLPHRWSEYDTIAKNTPEGWGIHAAVLDRDIGPPPQVQKLSTRCALRAPRMPAPLTAADGTR